MQLNSVDLVLEAYLTPRIVHRDFYHTYGLYYRMFWQILPYLFWRFYLAKVICI